jgi:hypothetical protein
MKSCFHQGIVHIQAQKSADIRNGEPLALLRKTSGECFLDYQLAETENK